MVPESSRARITGPAVTLDIRQRARILKHFTSLFFAPGRLPVASWLRGCAAGLD